MPQVIPAIAAFAATSLGGIVVNAAVGVGLSLAASLLASVAAPPAAAQTTGVDLQQQIGANTPIQFPLGWSATAGLMVYPGTWGNDGNTPNAFAVIESVLSFLPVPGNPVPWIGTQKCTVDWGATPAEQGYPITDFRDSSGKDYAWLQYDDGTQTAASSYMVDKFGSHPTRPYTNAMVGNGLAKVRLTLLLNQNLWSSIPDVLFETNGIPLYNPAKDSSVGGSGAHRWGVYSTYEQSNNPDVQSYNIRRGIFYYPDPSSATGAQWVYGGNNKRALSAYRLPVDSWIAAINACDMSVTNADSSTEPQFRAGSILTCDTPPVSVVQDLLGASSGRMAEVGGIYEIMAGAPGASVYAFTDADIIISDGQSFAPFPGLDDTYNAVEATFTDPSIRWVSNSAPGRYNDGTRGTPDWEDEDGGRQLPASATFTRSPYANQVQRLMQTIANDNRQFRTHQFTLPPDAYGVVKPNSIVSWTSTRNGYTSKSFIVTSVSGKQGWNQAVAIRELDPSDYDFDPSTQQLPQAVGSLAFETAPPQPMSGWTAVASTVQDNAGANRRPAITVGATGLMPDVQSVHVQVRFATTKQLVFDGYSPYDVTVTSPAWQLSGDWCLPNTAFEVRGLLVPFSGRVTYWSNETVSGGIVTEGAWLGVTTPDIRIAAVDLNDTLQTALTTLDGWIVDDLPTEIATNAAAILAEATSRANGDATNAAAIVAGDATNAAAISTEAGARATAVTNESNIRLAVDASQASSLRSLYETVLDGFLGVSDSMFGLKLAQSTLSQSVAASAAGSKAQWTSDIQAAVGPTSAIAQSITDLAASTTVLNATVTANIQNVQTVLTSAINNAASATSALELQVTGGYAGSDPTQLTTGLLYQEQQTRIAGDSALSTAIALVSAGVGQQFDTVIGYNFDTTIQGWGGNGTPTWDTGGFLRPANQASGPYVTSPTGLAVVAATYAQVEARIKQVGSPTWSGLCWYQRTTDSTWDVSRQATEAAPTFDTNGFAVVTWSMTWDSTINQIRLDLSAAQTVTDYFDIDWVYIGRPSPGASNAQVASVQSALTTSILAEASSRQVLSTMVTGAADPTGLTLTSLSSGLIYQELTARSTADSSLNTLISGVSSSLSGLSTTVSGLSAAQSTLSASVTTLNGEVATNTTAITGLTTSVNDGTTGLAATNALADTLQSDIVAMGGATAAQQTASAVRTLRLVANDLAVQLADGILSNKQTQTSLAGTIASVSQQLNGSITATNGQVSLLGQAITQINLVLPNLATLDITSSLQGQVIANDNSISAIGSQITSINTTIGTLATNAALSALTSTVSANTAGLTATNTALTALTTTVGTKASQTSVTTLTGTVTSQGAAITAANSAITALQNTVNNGTTGVAATAAGLSSLTGTVSTLSGTTSSNSSAITALQNTVNNGSTGVAALNTALSSLSSTVSSQGSTITSQGSSITSLQSTVNNPTTGVAALNTAVATKASASALTTLTTTVTSQGTTLTAQATSLQNLTAALGGSTSFINVKAETLTGPSGYSRYGIVTAVNDNLYRSASLFIDTPTDHTQPTRVVVSAGQFAYVDGSGNLIVAIDDTGTFTAGSGAVLIDMNTGDFQFGT